MPPQASTLSGPSGDFSCTGAGGRLRRVLRVVRDDVQHRHLREARDRVGEIAAQPLRGLARQRADDHLVVAQRVPDLGERLQRHGVADDALAALDPGSTPGLQRRVQPLLALRAGGGARTARPA